MKKNVKKLFAVLLAAAMLMSLCACGGDDAKESESGKSYDFGDYEVVYKGASIAADSDGNAALVMTFDFTNNSDKSAAYAWTVFDSAVQDDTALEYASVPDASASLGFVGEDSFTEVEPGGTMKVSTAFKLNGTGKVQVTISDLLDHYSYTITVDPASLEAAAAGAEAGGVKGAKSAKSAKAAVPEPFLEWWSGDWYGWWTIRYGSGAYDDYDGYWWDACAEISIGDAAEDSAYNATVTLWDADGSRTGDLIGEVNASISPYGVGEHGTLFSEGGWFMDDEPEHADWIADPGLEDFANLLTIDGEYDGEDGSYTYRIYLRPWGTMWDDLSEDSRPDSYESWYLPLVNSGASMPDSMSQSVDSGSAASAAPAETEAPAPAPTEAPAAEPADKAVPAPTGKQIPFTLDVKTTGDIELDFNFSLPEGEWDLEPYNFPYNFNICNWYDGETRPYGTPFMWILFHDNEEKLNFYVADYQNLTETEGRTIGGVEMKGRIYDYVGYEQMQEYYGVLPNGVGVSIRFVKVPESLLPECHAILDTFSFD